jgi:Ca-activated chloride channel family protein
VTFRSPEVLFCLLLVPVVVAGLLRSRRLRSRRTRALGAQGLIATEPTRTRRVSEYLPAALFIAAIAVLIVACARPMGTVKLPQRTATVVVAIDVSNSMAATDTKPSRIGAAKLVAIDFVRQQPPGVRIGIVGFGGAGIIAQPPTADHAVALSAIGRLSLGGGTSLGAGLLTALDAIAGKTLHVNLTELANDDSGEIDLGYYGGATIVLISDGEDESTTDPVTIAKLVSTAGVRIETVGVGTTAGTTVDIGGFSVATALDATTLENVAKVTNGSYHYVDDGSAANALSKSIQLHFTVVTEHTELTALFAMAGVLLLAIGAVLSVLWFGRVI